MRLSNAVLCVVYLAAFISAAPIPNPGGNSDDGHSSDGEGHHQPPASTSTQPQSSTAHTSQSTVDPSRYPPHPGPIHRGSVVFAETSRLSPPGDTGLIHPHIVTKSPTPEHNKADVHPVSHGLPGNPAHHRDANNYLPPGSSQHFIDKQGQPSRVSLEDKRRLHTDHMHTTTDTRIPTHIGGAGHTQLAADIAQTQAATTRGRGGRGRFTAAGNTIMAALGMRGRGRGRGETAERGRTNVPGTSRGGQTASRSGSRGSRSSSRASTNSNRRGAGGGNQGEHRHAPY